MRGTKRLAVQHVALTLRVRTGCRIGAGGSSSVGEKAIQQLLAKEIMQALTPLHRGSTVT